MLSIREKTLVGKTEGGDTHTWLPLWMHLKDTSEVMRFLLKEYVPDGIRAYLSGSRPSEDLEKLCVFLGASHDLGKATAVFQTRVMSGMSQPWKEKAVQRGVYQEGLRFPEAELTKHATASAVLLENEGIPDAIVEIVGAHHGITRNKESKYKKSYQLGMLRRNYFGLENRYYQEAQKSLTTWAMKEAGISQASDIMIPSEGGALILSGLLIMADWIASNTKYFPLIDEMEEPDETIYPERVRQGIEHLRLPGLWKPTDTFGIDELCQKRFSFAPNEIQRATARTVLECKNPGILILEAQMGKGKTEAALLAAEMMSCRAGRGGLFFGLPTQATANGLFPRILQWAQNQEEQGLLSIRLAHGSAQYNDLFTSLSNEIDLDGDGGMVVHEWFNGRKQALLSDFVIGTVDQVLLASLKHRHVMLRHLGLADKVVIIDECHAYDAYMNVYLTRTLSWLGIYRVPVVILSATLPCATRESLIDAYLNRRKREDPDAAWRKTEDYPLVTWTDGQTVHQRTIPCQDDQKEVRIHLTTSGKRGEILRQKLEKGGCAGVICNTVKRAQALYKELERFFPGRVLLFHARFLPEDRAALEMKLLHALGKPGKDTDRPDQLIVVGTQTLEQSLDIDFDLLITDLCPMDLLLQRIGRLHRHGGRQRPADVRCPECWICGTEESEMEESALIYPEYLLKRTQMLLPETVRLPFDIAHLVQTVYREDEVPSDLAEMYEVYDRERRESVSKAETFCLRNPAVRQESKTIRGLLEIRINSDSFHNEEEEAAAVRKGEDSIEVLLLTAYEDGIGLVPWHSPGKRFRPDVLNREEAELIGRERIRLPHSFSKRYGQTLKELAIMGERLKKWRGIPLLHSASFLILDANLEARVGGVRMKYSQTEGLICDKEG